MATQNPITVSLSDLEAGTVPFSVLEAAFGPSSLGIILVKDLPSKYIELRHRLLSYASILANLPSEELAKLENPSAKWLVGWSLGRETLKNGIFDTQKGSYYVNCTFSDPNPVPFDPSFPEYTSPNIWPDDNLLPGFREIFESLCRLIIDTAVLVARACDRYGENTIPDYRKGCLEEIVRGSKTTKARLLHYFPPPPPPSSSIWDSITGNTSKLRHESDEGPQQGEKGEDEDEDKDEDEGEDDWCTTHLDHGCLTGLTSAMYIDESHLSTIQSYPSSTSPPSHIQHQFPPELTPIDLSSDVEQSPYAKAGLYIHSRTGIKTKITIPKDQLAFQTGEALQVLTKGRFMAVPHFVRGPNMNIKSRRRRDDEVDEVDKEKRGMKRGMVSSIARNTLAVFTQPNLDEIIDYRDSDNEKVTNPGHEDDEVSDGGGGGRKNRDESGRKGKGKGITFGEFAREIVTRNQPPPQTHHYDLPTTIHRAPSPVDPLFDRFLTS
ncbi:MAG: hypothetical protein M1823_002590 [Watsoniomyces obsoletus]|nr:MAG: hypothetical protein M1823_002590 [Watsoniomyces obsoletus]